MLGEGQAGLPLNSLMPRPANNGGRNAQPPNFAPNGGKFAPPNNAPQGNLPRAGTVFGTVSNTGEGWIEVRDPKGALERYMPFWTAAGGDTAVKGGYDRAVLEAISLVKVGDTIRLEWVWSERKRVVKLETWTGPFPDATAAPLNTAPNIPPNAVGYGGDPAPTVQP